MLRFLFPRLTPSPDRGRELFDTLVAEVRQPHWFMQGEVPDTLDGRFALLATILALATVRLERGGVEAGAASVALAERFVEAMDVEHREMGIGDPTLGKHVRKLVTALARRVELWRSVAEGGHGWTDAVASSVYRGEVATVAVEHSEAALRSLWQKLEATSDEALAQGRLG
jgi:cytochrome b pre-mRNA-processing protein 3